MTFAHRTIGRSLLVMLFAALLALPGLATTPVVSAAPECDRDDVACMDNPDGVPAPAAAPECDRDDVACMDNPDGVSAPPADQKAARDSDGDGLSNQDELTRHFTSAFLADSDFDGVDDGTEIQGGSNPRNPLDN